LEEFLYARNSSQVFVRNIPSIRCSLGPYNSSFFAHDGSAYRWMNLPPTLLSALEVRIEDGNWIDRPRLVALGANDNFVLITEKHAAIWDLGHYKTMANLLQFSKTQERGIYDIYSIVLHAHRFGSFVTQSRNGTIIHENLPPHSIPGLQEMITPISEDTKKLERTLLPRRGSEIKESLQRRPSNLQQRPSNLQQRPSNLQQRPSNLQQRPSNLQQRAQLRREWGEHKQQFTAQTKGMKVSLSLSISVAGISRLLG
jgi:hypothetical protein